jgi:hypothetical protein
MADYVPTRDGDLVIWLNNLGKKLPDHAKALNLSPAQLKEVAGRIDALTSAVAKNEQKRAEYKAAVRGTEALKAEQVPALRALVRLIKAQPGYTASIGADLSLISGGRDTLAALQAQQPSLSLQARAEGVKLSFRKGPADGVNVYARLAGEASWTFLGRDTRSPYLDRRPLQKPGVPEVREYQIRAVRRDEEIGPPSQIASITINHA